MSTASHVNLARSRTHPFGEHGILLALPISVALWALIIMPFVKEYALMLYCLNIHKWHTKEATLRR